MDGKILKDLGINFSNGVMNMKNIFRRIKYFFFYDLPYGISNLKKWFPIIWNDRDWDYIYLFEILKFKIKEMERLQKEHGHSIESEKIAADLRKCYLILKRITEEDFDYFDMAFHDYDKKWEGTGEHYMERYEKRGIGDISRVKQENKDFNMANKKENDLKQADIDFLFQFMAKHIQSWWD